MSIVTRIDPSYELYRGTKVPLQWNNLWKFSFEPGQDQGKAPSEFYVKEVSLPSSLPSLSTTSIDRVGSVYYKDAQFTNDMTVTYREDVNFDAYQFFSSWMDRVYDSNNGCFRSGDTSMTASVILYRYAVDQEKLKTFALEHLRVDKALTLSQMMVGTGANLVTDNLNRYIENGLIENRAENVENLLRNRLGRTTEELLSKSDAVSSIYHMRETAIYSMDRVYLTGIEEGSSDLTYGEAEPITLKAKMSVRRVQVEVFKSTESISSSETARILGKVLGRLI